MYLIKRYCYPYARQQHKIDGKFYVETKRKPNAMQKRSVPLREHLKALPIWAKAVTVEIACPMK